ncbi:ABC transporter substrate-binding protein [Paenibacillus ginsengarvi]|nr:extracellular solute-binding protein [Paenibacillus ginsengarvi]
MSIGLAALLAITAGCGSAKPENGAGETKAADEKPPAVSTEPVTLTFYNLAGIGDLTFETLIEAPIKKKYPYITLKHIKNGKGTSLADLLAAGTPPDLIHTTTTQVQAVVDVGLQYDMTELIKRHKFELGIFQDGVMDSVRKLSPKGEIYGLPANNNTAALYYNKDIFDQLGVPYPKDGMSWDEALEVAKKVTRVHNGTQYRGMQMSHSFLLDANPLSLNILDPSTHMPLQQADKWKSLFENWKRFYDIPGNALTEQTYGSGQNDFMKNRTVAMYVANNLVIAIEQANDPGFNWDMVSMPFFKEAPATATQMIAPLFMISPTVKNKDVAFQVVAEMFADQVQKESALTGRPSLMKNDAIKMDIGKDLPPLKGKNAKAFYVSKLAPIPSFSKYESKARPILNKAYQQYVLGQKDVNTALREATEEIKAAIEAEIQSKK